MLTNKNSTQNKEIFDGCSEGIEPSYLLPQSSALPLSYEHHKLPKLKNYKLKL